jgi:transmembrane sensor
MRENYLAKWLNNELSEEELKSFRESPEFNTYQKIVNTASGLEGADFDVEEALAKVRETSKPGSGKVVRMSSYRWVVRIAAAIVVFLGIAFLYMNSMGDRIHTDYAQQTVVSLPDASEVMMNAGSDISFNQQDWDTERHLKLNGEAYFKVAKGQVFTVETQAGTVTVLGTQFNVLQRGAIFVVTCYEGLVRVDAPGATHELPAGTGFRMVGTEAATFDTSKTKPSWTDAESSFQSMPLAFVLEELERQYGVAVETKNVEKTTLYTGSFSNTNLELALQSISTPLQLKYSVEGDKVLIYDQDVP